MEELKNKINKLNNELDRKTAFRYFFNFEKILDVFKDKDIIAMPIGNYTPKVVFIYDFDSEDDIILNSIREIYKKNNSNFFALYITPISKTKDSFNSNIELLNKELSIINPLKIIGLGVDFKLNANLNRKSCYLNNDDLEEIKKCIKNVSLKENNNKFTKARKNFAKCISFAIR